MSKAPLPDRVCSTALKKREMISWVNQMLDLFQPDERPLSLEQAMERADQEGNIKPLRQALLRQTGYDLGRFLKKPKRRRSQPRSAPSMSGRALSSPLACRSQSKPRKAPTRCWRASPLSRKRFAERPRTGWASS